MGNIRPAQGSRQPSSFGSNMESEAQTRSGLWHAWLLLTGPSDSAPQATIQERERLRRARLSSAVMFGMLILAVVILPLGLQDPSHATLGADVALFVACFIAAILNRIGQTTIAGLLLVGVLVLAIGGAVLGAKQLDFIYLPAFDLLALVIGVAGAVLPRLYMWLAALTAIGFVAADIELQPRTPALQAFIAQYGPYTLMARPVVLIFTLAILFQLLSTSVESALHRADRAEELAALEHTISAQRQQLEFGVQQILETHVRIANGDYSARAPMTHDNMLWQIASSLNNLMGRLQKSGVAEHQLRRTEDELRRLAAAIDDAQAGRHPLWPASSGTAADLIIERISGRNRVAPQAGLGQAQQRPPLPPGRVASAPYQEPQRFGGPMGPGESTGALYTPGTSPLEAPDFPAWQPADPFSNPAQNPQQGSRSGLDGAPENPWFLTPDA